MDAFERALWIALGALIAAIAGYFGSYFAEKGKNYATKEDFDDLRVQQQELTRATKQVEATISKEVWDRKRHWELKRDALLEAARCVSEVDELLVRADAINNVISQQTNASDRVKSTLMERGSETTTALNVAQRALARANLQVSVVANETVRGAFEEAIDTLLDVAVKVLADDAVDQYAPNRDRIRRAIDKLVAAIRAELVTVPTSS